MGLSASQARLLSLTARQSNIEYEGQQINQQRTTLSNESSNYYNSLLEMSVPVPPSTNDYTKIVYTFTIGGNEATVKEALPKKDGQGNTSYLVSYTTNLSTIGIQENESYKTSASSKKTYVTSEPQVKTKYNADEVASESKNYFLATMNRVGSTEEAADLRNEAKKTDGSYIGGKSPLYVLASAVGSADIIIGPDGYQITESTYRDIVSKDATNHTDNAKKCRFYMNEETEGVKADATRYAISYAQIPNQETFEDHTQSTNSLKNDIVYYIEEAAPDAEGTKKGLYSYKASNQSNFTVVEPQYADAFLSADLDINEYYQYESSSGVRFVKREDVEGNLNNETRTIATSAVATINVIKENTLSNAIIEFDAQGRIANITDEEGHTYTMTATTETDNAAYDDAYNQYEYNQYVYDQRQNEINANIKILQAQDKSLELRLSSLDTQHSAIQTELEAVKKVMSKNIDNSFKTFNA